MYVIARSPRQKPLSFFFVLNSSCIRDSLRKLLFFSVHQKLRFFIIFSLHCNCRLIIVAP